MSSISFIFSVSDCLYYLVQVDIVRSNIDLFEFDKF
jgi:hypothetical protein